MNEMIFVDTSAWIALIDRSDSLFLQAKEIMNQLRGDRYLLITTDFVLLEVANSMSRQPFRASVISYINGLRKLKGLYIVPASIEPISKGWLLYCDRIDKEWSLTDCISFAVMQTHNINKAFTSDHHFEQAGFIKLIKG